MLVPEDFVVTKFYQFAGGPRHNKYANTYQGSCPMCREGNSWLKKQRFYFIPEKNLVFCHNCGYSEKPIKWISEVSGCSVDEVLKEIGSDNVISEFIFSDETKSKKESETLPKDCINLFDNNQVSYYKDNKIVKLALDYLVERRIDIAVNRPQSIFISLTDKVHKNRIVLPFYDENQNIIHYQTRMLLDSDKYFKSKYISKIGSEKSIFNINNIDSKFEYIFIFEGPIDSCFVKNGIAIGGIQENSYQLFTNKQKNQINNYPFHKKIWVLDSQIKDSASKNKTNKLLEMGETVFIWPTSIGKICKDFNDIAITAVSNQIPTDFIINNSIKG